jgi:hypothetical protein
MSYGTNPRDQWRCTAYYVDKILKVAKPADLPVEQPTKFDLAINLKTRRRLAIGNETVCIFSPWFCGLKKQKPCAATVARQSLKKTNGLIRPDIMAKSFLRQSISDKRPRDLFKLP